MRLVAATAALAAVLSLLAAADALGSASTIAISNNTVCAILAGASPRAVQCAVPGAAVPTVSLANASFNSLSGGRDFLCGLRPDTSAAENLFCWAPTAPATTRKRLYDGPNTLAGVSVGANHVAANVNVNGSGSSPGVEFWRGVGGGFPQFVSGEYRSLTSGSGFSCGVDSNSTVRCWGRAGAAIEASFGNVSMSSIVAGVDRVCGLRTDGVLTCTAAGSQRLDVPFHDSAFEFSGVAVGANHSCAIRQSNRTVVCWHGAARYAPAGDTSFVLIVAGANLACGLTTSNYSVVCWGPNAINPAPTTLPLLKALPGLCIPSQSSCECGVFPDSESLCSGSVICSACDSKAPVLSPPPSPSSPPEPHKTSKLWLAYAIVGSVGALAGVCAIIYCLWRACRQNRVHNSVQPTIAAAAANVAQSQSQSQSLSQSPPQSIPRTRSGVFRRQTSRPIHRQRSGTSKSANISSFKTEAFAFAELAAATKNFALENKIGAGSYGTVYRGKLADGREVAIKRSETSPKAKKLQEKETAFQSELASLSRIHHKHLVGLVGFCDEREERLLVYEYMKNGSLYDHLHGGGGGGAMASWKMRIKVLLDAARGLEYLHNYAVPPIIHRDIKSSNILLDGSWVARVSDFGLSLERSAGGGQEEPVAARAVGTVGYMDPEYYGMQQLTTKSDVYGMGVVMLEVLTGRRAIFREEEQPRSVVDYAVPAIAAGEVGRVLDPTVAAPAAGGEAEAVELVAYTAVRCVSLEGRERPAMSDVVGNLENALAICDDNRGTLSSNSVQSVD